MINQHQERREPGQNYIEVVNVLIPNPQAVRCSRELMPRSRGTMTKVEKPAGDVGKLLQTADLGICAQLSYHHAWQGSTFSNK